MPTVFINNTPQEFTELEFKNFSKKHTIINAAGGFVYNAEGKMLVIYRNGKWDIPKGKVEKGEQIKDTAIREVEEECGVSLLKIVNPKPIISYHVYQIKDEAVLKQTYWYKMTCNDTSLLIPQLEEGITQVCWATKGFLKRVVQANTYESISLLISNHCL